MALQIRRGLEADRSSITPLEGELIYVTDTKVVYVGDGTTAGGVLVSGDVVDDTTPQLGGNLDLNGNNITGTGNINITGTITATGNVNLGDASADNVSVLGSLTTSLTPKLDSDVDIGGAALRWRNGYFAGLTVDGQIDAESINSRLVANDSTISFDPTTGVFDGNLVGNVTGNLTGDVTGNVTGNVTGVVDGELIGSVFGDNSTLLVDGVNNVFTGNIRTRRLIVSNPDQPGDGLNGGIGEVNIDVSSNDNRSLLNLRRKTTDDLTGNTDAIYGTVTFGRDDANGLKTTAIMFGRENSLYFGVAPDGLFNAANKFFVWRDYKLGIGLTTPTEALDVNGSAKMSGTVTAAGFIGSVFADDSATIVDGITGAVTAQSFVQFGSLTSTERNALTPANGMVIYNTTNNKFEGYQNGGWINLDDGLAAS